MQVFSGNGQSYTLGRLLGSGAKGDVYIVLGHPQLAAKLYRSPISDGMRQRLELMVKLSTPRLQKISAWPIDTLAEAAGGGVTGFLMPNFAGFDPIHQLLGVKSRLEYFQNSSWPFLIHTAANTARAFSVIHEHGHLIGDVSSTNMLVSGKAIVSLLDCDNYQITTPNEQYLCEGGTTGYTPPELIGIDHTNLPRTRDHDHFGLSVIIFQLLFLGRHPFSGKFLGAGEKDLDEAIREYRFAYGADAGTRQMEPPPGTLPLEAMPASAISLFGRAFLSNARPKPHEWVDALERLSKSLRKCERHNNHYYYNALAACPWCEIENESGVRLFNFILVGEGQYHTVFDEEEVWAQIVSVPPPGAPPALPQKGEAEIEPAEDAQRIFRKRRMRNWLSIPAVISATATVHVLGLPWWASLALLVVIGLFGIVIVKGGLKVITGDNAGEDLLAPEMKRIIERKRQIQQVAEQSEQRWSWEAGERRFFEKLEELRNKRTEYLSLPALRQRKLRELEKTSRERQVERFLDGYLIAKSSIPDIGQSQKITLLGYGIETAADVKREAVMGVPGFEGMPAYKLLSWRRSIEEKFVYNPAQDITQIDKVTVDREINSVRMKLEQDLGNGPTHLRRINREIAIARQTLCDEVRDARTRLAQAEEDFRIATMPNSPALVIASVLATTALILLLQAYLNRAPSLPNGARENPAPATASAPSR
ncbi:MAG: helix-hairpin-helix domain-containing protein [Blastocatellia bacterium]